MFEDFPLGKLVILAGLGVGAYLAGPRLLEEWEKRKPAPEPTRRSDIVVVNVTVAPA